MQNFFRLSPGFCFADGLASLALLRQGMKKGSGDSVFDWNVTGASICYLAAEVLSLISVSSFNFTTIFGVGTNFSLSEISYSHVTAFPSFM